MVLVKIDEQENIVVLDDWVVFSDMVCYLVLLGYKDIVIISGLKYYYLIVECLEGIMYILVELGMIVLLECIIEGKNSYESGIECVRILLIQILCL